MDKPELMKIEYHDYIQCRDYINWKYNCDIDNYAGHRFDGTEENNPPYQCFWHFISRTCEVHNGSLFYICEDMLFCDEEEWINEIIQFFINEFDQEYEYMVEW